jgi:hypothetical protein
MVTKRFLSSLLGFALVAWGSNALSQDGVPPATWVLQNSASTEKHQFSVLATGAGSGVGEERYAPLKIRVLSRTTGAVVQEIDVADATGTMRAPSQLAWTVDANFDGHADLAVPSSDGGAGPNSTINFYLFNPTTGRYEIDMALSEMSQISINDNQTITSASRGSCCQHAKETYRYIQGKLTMVASWEESLTPDGKWMETSTGRLVGGKMRYSSKRRRAPKEFR